jgi:Uma2 family endonuclease
MSVAARPLTWDDIKDWPEDPSRRCELVHGEIVMSPSATAWHAWICSDLHFELTRFVKASSLGVVFGSPIDVILAPNLVYVPDLCFVSQPRVGMIRDQVHGAPDLMVEVISESNRTHDTVVKFADYAKHGVAEYWLVDPREREISTWRAVQGRFELIGRCGPGGRLATQVLEGLQLDPAAVFGSRQE